MFTYLIQNGICSAFQWFKISNNPKKGVKKVTTDKMRRRVPKSPQVQTAIFGFIGKNPLCTTTDFKWSPTHVFMLHAIERPRAVFGSIGIPNIESSLNIVSRPPVVAVVVVAKSRRMIWRGTWWRTSRPDYERLWKIMKVRYIISTGCSYLALLLRARQRCVLQLYNPWRSETLSFYSFLQFSELLL